VRVVSFQASNEGTRLGADTLAGSEGGQGCIVHVIVNNTSKVLRNTST